MVSFISLVSKNHETNRNLATIIYMARRQFSFHYPFQRAKEAMPQKEKKQEDQITLRRYSIAYSWGTTF